MPTKKIVALAISSLFFTANSSAFTLYKGENGDIQDFYGKERRTSIQSSTFNSGDWEVLPDGNIDGLGRPDLADAPIPATPATISEIQGNDGSGSDLNGETISVTAQVSAVFTSKVKGFYLYDNDNDPLSSDGLFVESNEAVEAGDFVTVEGIVKESYGMTQLTSVTSVTIDSAGNEPAAAVDLEMLTSDNGSFSTMLQRYDGMLVKLPEDINPSEDGDQDMRVSRPYMFDFDNFSENMSLAYKRPNVQPNQRFVAGSDQAFAAMDENDDFRLIIFADNSNTEADMIDYYPSFNPQNSGYVGATENAIRINDSIVGLQGVISLAYGDYRLYVPNDEAYYIDTNNVIKNTPRTSAPEINSDPTADNKFVIKVATQNVLNLFNSPFGGDANLQGNDRGANSDFEYQRQLAKITAAIHGLDADIIGLMEIENNGFGEQGSIAQLVDSLNIAYDESDADSQEDSDAVSKRYVFIGFDTNGNAILDNEDAIGTDVITSGILYRPAKVTIKNSHIIPMPQQHAPTIVNSNNQVVKDSDDNVLESGDNYMRDSVAAEFIVNSTGKYLTIAVNHFKSKGSTCWEDWQDTDFSDNETWDEDPTDTDKQGSCENFRVAAAVQLADEMEKLGDDRILLGDFNAYAYEDPMLVLTDNPTNKTLTTSRNTFIHHIEKYGDTGATVQSSYGYINAIEHLANEGDITWSYSYNDEIGSLDHLLITPSLENRLLDAADWHINSSESPLLDYNTEYKGNGIDGDYTTDYDNGVYQFYHDDAFRSSDHDPAMITLQYQYAETENNNDIVLPVSSDIVKIPYNVPTGVELNVGDKVMMKFDRLDDESVVPTTPITESNVTFLQLEAQGLPTGDNDVSIYAVNSSDGSKIEGSEVSLNINVVKPDSLTPKVVVNENDGSGGSFGFGALLTLLGLGFLRRKKG
ncbi:ExeM/NucH family extracellular endonuclease [Vibrio sp. SS-MA-C1-2]|uniref:ExeM/NucH family extracellular endonuclease n=1 Tax=Vibrio sp. SS-MA-C1-2 TaxID=2908646 RepID=UPI001F22C957|nr:ExeM/NucH family extracellular endonuclease [Vibrio sp. SS-MA-C1-2]UJF17808.1 ExeM/NucH family extracellular endonuclease [Vibrio sp. SS-MA-C1-2]